MVRRSFDVGTAASLRRRGIPHYWRCILSALRNLAISCLASAALFGGASPALAGEDIPWTWNNSSDKDVKGAFKHYGEHFQAYEYEGNDYLDYDWSGIDPQRWYIPGSEDKTLKDLNLEIAEGKATGFQACETKFAAPDDCSDWKWGVS